MHLVPEKAPRNWLERMLWLYGRKFWLAFFAGVSGFAAFVLGVWVAARTDPERGRLVEQMVSAYLLAAGAMVGAYAGTNAWIEAAHAKAPAKPTAPAPTTPRTSGTVSQPDEVL